MVALEEGHVRNEVGGCDLACNIRSDCVCKKMYMDRGNGSGDKSRAKRAT